MELEGGCTGGGVTKELQIVPTLHFYYPFLRTAALQQYRHDLGSPGRRDLMAFVARLPGGGDPVATPPEVRKGLEPRIYLELRRKGQK